MKKNKMKKDTTKLINAARDQRNLKKQQRSVFALARLEGRVYTKTDFRRLVSQRREAFGRSLSQKDAVYGNVRRYA